MPAQVVALLVLFIAVAVVSGALATVALGPRKPLAAILPVAASFVALYLIGHRLGFRVGPQVAVFGFEVALFWDVTIAVVAAFLVALVQRAALRRRPAG